MDSEARGSAIERMRAGRQALVEDLFVEALDLPDHDVAAFLGQSTDDETVRAAVLSLVADARAAQGAVAVAVGRAAATWQAAVNTSAPTLIGRRLGPYEITGVAGQGGMGTVYRARRADGQFEQEVAVKLVRHGDESETALDRFRQERQILARLIHPGIARLLDGGAAHDEAGRDVPYLVMEFVEGEPITTHCRLRNLSVMDRLTLFREVCRAVSHAHQQLVVHRDLKPANILVTRGGEVKLLDFGIAKLLGDEGPGLTRGGAALTPAYATPEQVTGVPITVATDVYALGLVLYELLARSQAQQVANDSPMELTRVVCTVTPPPPSDAARALDAGLARALAGDLDTIVLKALHKDPARRYGSVEQLADDVARHVDGRPVIARPDTFGYRAGKFIRRHATPVAAAAAVAVTLVTALVVTTREARARAAEAQRAERRLQQVRELANTFLFDMDRRIRLLEDSGPARRFLLNTAIEYLGSLTLEDQAGRDLDRMTDLANGYEYIGDVFAEPSPKGLGDSQAAKQNYTLSLTLWQQLERLGGVANPRTREIEAKIAGLTSAAVAPPVPKPMPSVPAAPVPAPSRIGAPLNTRGMVRLPAGRVLLGSPPTEPGHSDREAPQHEVALGEFWIDANEVSGRDFAAFVRARPEWRRDQVDVRLADTDYLNDWPSVDSPPGDGSLPVTWVSWHAARAYCGAAGKRLPTEAEWEYAARAGTTQAFFWGDEWDPERANASNLLMPVGLAAHRNHWGLHDMLGNAMEWTSSLFRPYPYVATDGRESPSNADERRVVRGGSYSLPPQYLRSAVRNSSAMPRLNSRVIGFRCAI